MASSASASAAVLLSTAAFAPALGMVKPMQTSLAAFGEVVSLHKGHQYTCAEELAIDSTCECMGFVKMGSGSRWSSWLNASGNISCSTGVFGDATPGIAKECVCQPTAWYCASEWGRQDAYNCTDSACALNSHCKCQGSVRFGYGTRWTSYRPVNGWVHCADDVFGDPYPTQGKLCECKPELTTLNQLLDNSEPASGDQYAPIGRLVAGALAVTLCYFSVYTWLTIARALTQISSIYNPGIVVTALMQCTSSVHLAPMIVVTFFAVNKRAETLTAGSPAQYGYPPRYLGIAAIWCAAAFCFQVAFHLLAEWIVAQQAYKAREQRRQRALAGGPAAAVSSEAEAREVWSMTRGWRYLNGFAVGITYLLIVVILVGMALMTEPRALVQSSGVVEVASGTVCTVGLAVVYFSVYLVLHCLKTRDLLRNLSYSPVGVVYSSFGAEVMGLAANAINFAPMLCTVFMAAQIASDWQGQGLSSVVEVCIYTCTFAVLVQVVLVLLTPFMSDAELEVTGSHGEVNFVTRNRGAFILISFVRWAAMTALYGGVMVLCVRLWNTKACPPLMHLLARLAAIYFVSYLILWVAITGRVLMEGGLLKIIRIMSVVRDTLSYCPMLAILALISFVRARHLTNRLGQPGVPQGYVQDYMYLFLWALVVQLIMTLVSGVVNRAPIGTTMHMEEDQDKSRGESLPVFIAIYSIATAVLFFSVVVIVYGLFTITPHNAVGNSARFV